MEASNFVAIVAGGKEVLVGKLIIGAWVVDNWT